MSKYVLVDVNSGFVWGDADAVNPIEACRAVDANCREYGRTYEDIGGERWNGRSGYDVYLAPEDFTDCGDGQDPEYIKMVEAFSHVARIATR